MNKILKRQNTTGAWKRYRIRLEEWWRHQMFRLSGRSARLIRVTIEPSTYRSITLRKK